MKLFCYLKLLLYQITFKIEKNVDSWKKKKKHEIITNLK